MPTVREVLEQALGHHRAGDLAAAERLYRQVAEADPSQADAFHLLGVLALQTGRFEEAATSLSRAVSLQPAAAGFQANLAAAYQALGRRDEAAAAYREALRLQPDLVQARANLGNLLFARGQIDEAAACFEEVLRLRPDHAEARTHLGNARVRQGRLDEAVACYRRALQAAPRFATAHHNLGAVLQRQGKLNEAITSFREALRHNPGYARTHSLLGDAFKALGKADEAMACYRESLRLQPGDADTLNHLGGVLADTYGEVDEALDCFRQAAAAEPNHWTCHSNYLLALHYQHGNDPRLLHEEHLAWARRHADPLTPAAPDHCNDPDPDRRLRVGFVLGSLGRHPAHFIEPVLLGRDRARVYVVCFLAQKRPGGRDGRLRALADRWHDVGEWTDERLAQVIREEGIDVLVDLAGHSGGNRLLACARKPAPVQLTQFGYPTTTGMAAMDYRLTDPYLDPPGLTEAYHTEELVRLPETAWCYQAPPGPPANRLPALGTGRLTLGSFNRLSKLTPEVIELWSRLLEALPGSRLLLAGSGGKGDVRIRETFASYGIREPRLELRPPRPLEGYLQLYHEIDIALDPFPFTGGITTCDALWMGVPVISLAGKTCVARQGVSLLSNVGLQDWVADTPEGVIDIARRRAGDLPGLSRLRAGLRHVMKRSPLVDGRRYTRHLEETYRSLWRRWCASHKAPRG